MISSLKMSAYTNIEAVTRAQITYNLCLEGRYVDNLTNDRLFQSNRWRYAMKSLICAMLTCLVFEIKNIFLEG